MTTETETKAMVTINEDNMPDSKNDDGDSSDDDDYDNKPTDGQRASFRINASASESIPPVLAKRLIPPILPHHRPYIASQQGYDFVVASPESPVSSAHSPVQAPFAARSPAQSFGQAPLKQGKFSKSRLKISFSVFLLSLATKLLI